MKPLVSRGVTIKVDMFDVGRVERKVPAEVVGRWAVHVTVNDGSRRAARQGYTVTHIPSGLAVAAGQPYATAIALARAFDERLDVEVWGEEQTQAALAIVTALGVVTRFPEAS